MPQGKGTYGSKVGRPPKKKKYQGGGSIDPFSTKNPDSVVVKQALEEMKDQADIPTSNAMERNETSPMGEEVGTGMYKDGGEVRDTSKKGLEKHWKESVERIKEGALKGRIKHTPKRAGSKSKDKPYNITDVVKTVGRKENIKKGYKEYWDKENVVRAKAIKKKKGKK
jgi:hypothetical protein